MNSPVGSSPADILADAWVTRSMGDETRRRLAGLGRTVTLAAGDQLTREGETTESLGILLEGRIALRVRVPERGSVTILTVEPGDIVGWSALVPPHRASATAVALAPSEVAIFDGEVLRKALAADDNLAADFYPALLYAVARRLEGTRLQLLDLFSQRWVEPW